MLHLDTVQVDVDNVEVITISSSDSDARDKIPKSTLYLKLSVIRIKEVYKRCIKMKYLFQMMNINHLVAQKILMWVT